MSFSLLKRRISRGLSECQHQILVPSVFLLWHKTLVFSVRLDVFFPLTWVSVINRYHDKRVFQSLPVK